MLDISKCKIVKQGILLYDNTLEYSVIIIESDIFYGTGDFDDPPEIAEDKECLCYYAWCDSPHRRNEFFSGTGPEYGGMAFMSLDEAVMTIEKKSYFSHWID